MSSQLNRYIGNNVNKSQSFINYFQLQNNLPNKFDQLNRQSKSFQNTFYNLRFGDNIN